MQWNKKINQTKKQNGNWQIKRESERDLIFYILKINIDSISLDAKINVNFKKKNRKRNYITVIIMIMQIQQSYAIFR